jgi:coronin-1B/1C/6
MSGSGNDRSKFRHVYGEHAKQEGWYQDVKNPLAQGEGTYVDANDKFVACAKASGGGPIYILPLGQVGRVPANHPMLDVHKGKAWDFHFHPFYSNFIGTCSDDMTVAVTQFPMEGLTDAITEPRVRMEGHSKKVMLCSWNPSANNILASASFDRTVKVWNVETSDKVADFGDFGETIFSMEWNGDGSMIATTSKDHVLRLWDPRQPDAVQKIENVFEGKKSSKVFWSPRNNWIGATGFNKTSKQELKVWDLNNLSAPLGDVNFGQDSSVLVPYYDNDTSLLFLYGKGNGAVSFCELNSPDGRVIYQLGGYRNTTPQKGGGFIAKRACDVWKCEIARFLKLTGKDIIPISFMVPRKAGADIFQEDIYPDCLAPRPALEADAWIDGENSDPLRMPMDPSKRGDSDMSGGATFTAKKTYKELEAENAELRARVAELEAQLGGGDS